MYNSTTLSPIYVSICMYVCIFYPWPKSNLIHPQAESKLNEQWFKWKIVLWYIPVESTRNLDIMHRICAYTWDIWTWIVWNSVKIDCWTKLDDGWLESERRHTYNSFEQKMWRDNIYSSYIWDSRDVYEDEKIWKNKSEKRR